MEKPVIVKLSKAEAERVAYALEVSIEKFEDYGDSPELRASRRAMNKVVKAQNAANPYNTNNKEETKK